MAYVADRTRVVIARYGRRVVIKSQATGQVDLSHLVLLKPNKSYPGFLLT